ncbi:MAG: hypothetical protein HKN87_00985 [Saprospiraceae bacterium]|nr:hypothetical protein [Saprospiraceae bacterium]
MMEFKGVTYMPNPVQGIDQSIWNLLPKDVQQFYDIVNGIVAFNGGLHIRGLGTKPAWHDLAKYWQGDMALHEVYAELSPSDIPFAQDCLGDQYFIRVGTVWNLMSETGDVEDLELEFDEFISECLRDPVEFLSLEPLVSFMDGGGSLQPGHLLKVDPPFIEESTSYQLTTSEVDQQLLALFEIYRHQMR